jgi:hypothetical protein
MMRIARTLLRGFVAAALLATAALAHAHKASDAYLQIGAADGAVTVRWDIALRDLDAAVAIDTDDDGRLTAGEIKAAWPRIEAYSLPRLAIDGCPLAPVDRALERRNDGAYAVILLRGACTLAATPVIRYSLFREIDPTHRGIAKLQRADGQAPTLSLLDPTHDAGPVMAGAGPAGAAAAVEGPPPHGDAQGPSDAGAGRFLGEGIRHILGGYDHILFLLCLLLPSVMRRTPQGWQPVPTLRQAVLPVVGIVSAFTVAHSITLALAATHRVSLPPAFIEPAIAVTIILAALDNLYPIFPVRRVVVTFAFGLVHGFGFAGVLSELNLPTGSFVLALLEFNVGLEIGQLLVVVAATAALFLLRARPHYRSWVIGGGSAAAMAVGTLWLIERTANVSLLPF